MTQTAVSYQIKLHRRERRAPLFLRRPRQIALTEVGQRLAPKVTEPFELMQEAVASWRRRPRRPPCSSVRLRPSPRNGSPAISAPSSSPSRTMAVRLSANDARST